MIYIVSVFLLFGTQVLYFEGLFSTIPKNWRIQVTGLQRPQVCSHSINRKLRCDASDVIITKLT